MSLVRVQWKGWWGDNPVFHTPVVVLTHHPRPVLEMDGGTTFHFVDADPVSALKQARALAGDLDVRIGGGVSTVRQFLEADLVDHSTSSKCRLSWAGANGSGMDSKDSNNASKSKRPHLQPEFSI